ncbi:MAG: hypothetical protein SFX19_09585 [Alphaproteobacteria bacterium]|nr:hypothetical protein [Alphaproteobacteria bacterium]
MQIVSFELPDAVVQMFDQLCLENKAAKNAIFQELVVRYLEDVEDGIAANLMLEESGDSSNWKSLDDLAQELQLDR